MIYLISFINLCLIFAVWRISKRRATIKMSGLTIKIAEEMVRRAFRRAQPSIEKALEGKLDKVHISAKIAEKMADRAFNMASSANLGVIALQKSLARPMFMTKQQGLQNEMARKKVDDLFLSGDKFDYLRPLLSDEENELVDKVLDERAKREYTNGQGEQTE